MSRSRRSLAAEMDEHEADLTPMIDIVFNLLIFFMCSTKFIVPEGMIEAFLPKAEGAARTTPDVHLDEARIKLLRVGDATVVKVGEDALNRPGELEAARYASKAPVWARLATKLQALVANHRRHHPGEPMPVILDIRPQVPTKHAVSALNEVVRAGLKEVTFARPEHPVD